MSRTYRKRFIPFEKSFECVLEDEDTYLSKSYRMKYGRKWKERLKAQYYSRSDKWHGYNLPKHFRKSVNRNRRRRDHIKEHLLLTRDCDTIDFDPWNCKTSNSWGYW